MAIQTLLPGYNPGAALGESLGAGLGSGLSGILEGLAANRLQQLQQAQQQNQQAQMVKSLEGLGLSANQAQALSSLQPDLQQLFVKDLLAQPAQQAYAQALGLLEPSQTTTQQEAPLQQMMNLKPTISPMESLQLLQGKIPQTMLQQMQQVQPQIQPQIEQPKPLPRLTEKQATEIAKIRREEHKQSQKEKHEAFKFSKEFIKDIGEKSKSARQAIGDLDRMEELEKSGKLNGPGFDALLTRSGLDIAALRSPESQEFNKIAQNFLRNAKQYYGGRVSNFEVEQFLKTIPSLSQSPEGRKRVIANLKNISRMELAYNKAVKDIIKENKGIPPFDLQLQVDERVDKQADKLADLFKKDLAKKVPQSESSLRTLAGGLAGSTLGLVGNIIPTAAKLGLAAATKGKTLIGL